MSTKIHATVKAAASGHGSLEWCYTNRSNSARWPRQVLSIVDVAGYFGAKMHQCKGILIKLKQMLEWKQLCKLRQLQQILN